MVSIIDTHVHVQVGWATGPAHLISAVAKAHQFLVFTVPSALQAAVAHGLDHEAQFFTSMGAKLQRKRATLAQRLTAIGFAVLPAEGTYFLLADIRYAATQAVAVCWSVDCCVLSAVLPAVLTACIIRCAFTINILMVSPYYHCHPSLQTIAQAAGKGARDRR